MPKLTWDTFDVRNYHTGIDLGVLYDSRTGRGVSWSGLVSVSETTAPTSANIYFDGNKVGGEVYSGDYMGTLSAFTYPEEFGHYDGSLRVVDGVQLRGQSLRTFGLCYRTRVEHRSNETPTTHKLHILYNLRAIPGAILDSTISGTPAPTVFTWTLSATPEPYDGYRPTAHVVVDERDCDPELWSLLARRLYGYTDNDSDSIANLPPFAELMDIFKDFWRVLIIDEKDGTWVLRTKDDDILVVEEPFSESPVGSKKGRGGIFVFETDDVIWLDEEKTHYTLSDSREEGIA